MKQTVCLAFHFHHKIAMLHSAHTEAGWFAGRGKLTIAYIPERQEPELMYKLFNKVCCTIDELTETLKLKDTDKLSKCYEALFEEMA